MPNCDHLGLALGLCKFSNGNCLGLSRASVLMVHQHDVLGNVSLHISLQFFFLVLIYEEKLLLSEQQELCRVRLLLLTLSLIHI